MCAEALEGKELIETLCNCLRDESDGDVSELLYCCAALVMCLSPASDTAMPFLELLMEGCPFDRWQKSFSSCKSSNSSHSLLKCHIGKNATSSINIEESGLVLLFISLCQSYHERHHITDLIELFRLKLSSVTCSECESVDGTSVTHSFTRVDETDHSKVAFLISAIDKTLPFLLLDLTNTMQVNHSRTTDCDLLPSEVQWVMRSLENICDSQSLETQFCALREHLTQEWFKSWKTFDYLTKVLMPFLTSHLVHFEADDSLVVQTNINLFYDWTQCLGVGATNVHICPLFHSLLSMSDSDLEQVKSGSTALTRASFIIFTVTILGTQHHSNPTDKDPIPPLQDFLTRHISIISLCGGSLSSVVKSVSSLLASFPHTLETVLAVLWACLVNKSTAVRSATSQLWTLVASFITEEPLLSSRVVPALVTMATDGHESVRSAALEPLVKVASAASASELGGQITAKCSVQLESMLEDSQLDEHPSLREHLALVVSQSASSLSDGAIDAILYAVLLPRLCRAITHHPPVPHQQGDGELLHSCLHRCLSLGSSSPHRGPFHHASTAGPLAHRWGLHIRRG